MLEKTPDAVYVAITVKNKPLHIMQFLTYGRSPDLPYGAETIFGEIWFRVANRENVEHEVREKHPGFTKFRIIRYEDIPTDRSNRRKWKDNGKEIK